ncbi:TetR/AcrR family transcriptional regulator [Clostridium isatidis]|uniref:TetR/AcrR family transcriptional regulator n=1 Tax=Clostridium isatidis TaxID=182773 RepID=UPI003AAD1340
MEDNKELSTKMQIIKAAIKLYKKYGYSNITVQDICNEVGITRSAFYYHFKSKDDIFDDFYLYSNTYALDKIADILSSNDYIEQFYSLFNMYLEQTMEAGPEVFGQLYKHSIDKKLAIFNPKEISMRKVYEALLKKAQDSGQILNKSPVSDLIDAVVYVTDGISLVWCSSNSSFDLIEENRRILDTLFIVNK